MLVLGRKVGERVIIGNAVIEVVDINREGKEDSARLGIDATRDIPVHRKEVYDNLSEEQKGGRLVYVKPVRNPMEGRLY